MTKEQKIEFNPKKEFVLKVTFGYDCMGSCYFVRQTEVAW